MATGAPWWSARHSVRAQVLVWFVALLALATLLVTAFERHILLSRLDERVGQELRQEVNEMQRLVGGVDVDGSCRAGTEDDGTCTVGRNPETGEPFGADVEAIFDTFLRRSIPGEHETMVTFVDGDFHAGSIEDPAVELETVPAFTDAVAATTTPLEGVVHTSAGDVAYLAVPVGEGETPRGVFAVAQFLAPQRAIVLEGIRVVTVANVILLLLACALGTLALGRLLRPVRLVTEAATEISETDLSRRIEVTGTDEVSRLATTFNSMLDRLSAAFASQREFLDDAAHELRTPITIVRGNLELLPDDPVARSAVVEILTDELDRMSRFVDDLLLLAKAERPDFMRVVDVDLKTLVLDVDAKARTLADRDWVVIVPEAVSVCADPQRLTQAVLQLVQNAVAHTEEDGRVEIGAAADRGGAKLWVADDGPGVDPSIRERMFARFERGSARSSGAGLGLSIVDAICRAHGGRIEVSSARGRGSRFTIVLPVDPSAGDVPYAAERVGRGRVHTP